MLASRPEALQLQELELGHWVPLLLGAFGVLLREVGGTELPRAAIEAFGDGDFLVCLQVQLRNVTLLILVLKWLLVLRLRRRHVRVEDHIVVGATIAVHGVVGDVVGVVFGGVIS